MVGDFSRVQNLVGDRSPMAPMMAKPLIAIVEMGLMSRKDLMAIQRLDKVSRAMAGGQFLAGFDNASINVCP